MSSQCTGRCRCVTFAHKLYTDEKHILWRLCRRSVSQTQLWRISFWSTSDPSGDVTDRGSSIVTVSFIHFICQTRWGPTIYNSGTWQTDRIAISISIRYDTIVCITCSKKLTGTASLVHHTGQTKKLKEKRTKNKSRSMISPVRSRDHEGSPGSKEY